MKPVIIIYLVLSSLSGVLLTITAHTAQASDSLAAQSTVIKTQAEVKSEEERKKERTKLIKDIARNVSTGLVLIAALLMLYKIILRIEGRGPAKVVQVMDLVVVFVTTKSEEEAVIIGRALVEERLAACANIGRIRSIYSRQRKVEDESEVQMMIKTTRARLKKLTERVRELHSSDIPEIVALPIIQGFKPYFDWIIETTDSKPWWKRIWRRLFSLGEEQAKKPS